MSQRKQLISLQQKEYMCSANPHTAQITISVTAGCFLILKKIRKDINFHSAEELTEFLQDAFIELDKATVYKQLQYLKNDLKAVIDAGGVYL